ncbi:MAG: helix-turn-helix transcriptional regulator [Gammaproteobacteria bacterium]|nr:MAG: helix-turn-helix transcriptional regulator [Gammaproteobacteria bacterium]
METKAAVATLAALAQESRLAIFRHLVEIGPEGAVAGAIATALELAPATLSFHLKELSHADLVVSSQEGRFIRYAANFGTMNGLIAYLTENCCAGESCRPACAPAKPQSTRRRTQR